MIKPLNACTYRDCQRAQLRDTGLCIFHAPASVKDPSEFEAELRAFLQDGRYHVFGYNFSGFVFVSSSRKIQILKGLPFKSTTSFREAVFCQWVDFTGTTFHGPADFSEAVFEKEAEFVETRFIGDTYFNSARFKSGLWMQRATFEAMSVFNFCHLFKRILLDGVSFANLGLFTGCEIHGSVVYRWPGDMDKRGSDGKVVPFGRLEISNPCFAAFNDILDLGKNLLREQDQLTLSKVREHGDMSHILLEGTDCTKVRFYDCAWPRLRSRNVVGDEYRARKWKRNLFTLLRLKFRQMIRGKLKLRKRLHTTKQPTPWLLIAGTYEQLARRFHEDFNHVLGNDFDRGVFATRLLSTQGQTFIGSKLWPLAFQPSKKWIGHTARSTLCVTLKALKRFFSLGAFFRYTSFYGGSISLPFAWLLGITFLFAGLYQSIVYDGWLTLTNWIWPNKGLIAALRIAGLNRTWLVDELKGSTYELLVTTLALAQVVITAILITLLIFAVRRRFKHGD